MNSFQCRGGRASLLYCLTWLSQFVMNQFCRLEPHGEFLIPHCSWMFLVKAEIFFAASPHSCLRIRNVSFQKLYYTNNIYIYYCIWHILYDMQGKTKHTQHDTTCFRSSRPSPFFSSRSTPPSSTRKAQRRAQQLESEANAARRNERRMEREEQVMVEAAEAAQRLAAEAAEAASEYLGLGLAWGGWGLGGCFSKNKKMKSPQSVVEL